MSNNFVIQQRQRGNRNRHVPLDRIPQMTQKQTQLLLAFVRSGDNPETGQSNEAAFWVSPRHQPHRGLWRRGLLQIVAEHPQTDELRYDISSDGRRVAMVLLTQECSAALIQKGQEAQHA